MEPNKLEQQIKEKLDNRIIQPSAGAWDRLDTLLDAVEKPKAKFPWMYVAAGFAALLMIGTAYFNLQENPIENQKNGVVIHTPVTLKTKSKLLDSTSLIKEEKKSVRHIVKQSILKSNQFYKSKQESIVVKNNLDQNQKVKITNDNEKSENESISLQTKTFTVDELLTRGDKSASINNKSDSYLEVHVNANQLLLQVEKDLEPTFRQSVFSKIADNFRELKETVVSRNKE